MSFKNCVSHDLIKVFCYLFLLIYVNENFLILENQTQSMQYTI